MKQAEKKGNQAAVACTMMISCLDLFLTLRDGSV
jgi:hypothetical protein